MDAQDCLDTLRQIRDVSFATVDGEGHPQIRIIDVMLVEKGRLYFCTSRGKDFHAQLLRDPHVAIVGMTRDFKMVRLAGEARFVTDDPHAWIDRIFDQNPSMNDRSAVRTSPSPTACRTPSARRPSIITRPSRLKYASGSAKSPSITRCTGDERSILPCSIPQSMSIAPSATGSTVRMQSQ